MDQVINNNDRIDSKILILNNNTDDNPYILPRRKEILNCAWIQRTDKAMMAKYEHIAITFDEKQRNNLNKIMQEMIKFVFDFNWEF